MQITFLVHWRIPVHITLLIHIAAGVVGIIMGYVALSAAKGGRLHRGSGVLFVYAMVPMALFAAWVAAAGDQTGNVIAGLLTAYLVITALTTVRPRTTESRRAELGAMLSALAIGVAGVTLAVQAFASGDGTMDGVPAAMYLWFGLIALAAGLGDLRMIRSGGLLGARRMARHLWRMCFALWIAAGSFFLGQADEFPEPLRIFPLLAIPAFLPLVVMLYWLWRVRVRKSFRWMAGARAPAASSA